MSDEDVAHEAFARFVEILTETGHVTRRPNLR
jgi:hypothetical protein